MGVTIRVVMALWLAGMLPLFIHLFRYKDWLVQVGRSTLADVVVILMWPMAFQSRNGRMYLQSFINGEGVPDFPEDPPAVAGASAADPSRAKEPVDRVG